MLLRVSLILAILLGIGTIVVTQKMARDHFTAMRNARNDFENRMKQQTTRATKAETTLNTTSNRLVTTSNTLVKTEEELNGTKQQLATVQEGLNKTKADLAKSVEERKAAQAELAKWESLGLKPEQISEMRNNLKTSLDAIAALEDEKKVLSRQITVLTNRIMLLVGDEYEVPLPSGTKGSVVAVDPKWNFVVLDIGAKENLLEGGVLMVHRNSQLVGKVRINEVMPNRSIASMMPGWKLGDIEEGDQVISKN
jgi:hypothetical protein